MEISRRDRYRGVLLGTLCGDALGAPYEWQKSVDIAEDLKKRGSLVPHEYEPFDYIDPWKKKRMVKKGHPTDDSELAAALAMSLLENRGLSPPNLYAKLRSFIIDRKSILAQEAYGSGSTLRAALEPPTYEASQRKFANGDVPVVPSNGSLMRCGAVPLWCGSNLEAGMRVAMEQSRVTHVHPVSQAACVAYTLFVMQLLEGLSAERAWYYTLHPIQQQLRGQDGFERVLELELSRPREEDIWPEPPHGPGDALLSLRAALWATLNAESFADGILKVISLGGDTDTYGAIAGGMLGGRFGLKGIPLHWQDAMQGRQIMLDLADRLYELPHP